ncbi:MAG: hypothetical protein WCP01_03785 [Methylococcaceae bacterium]
MATHVEDRLPADYDNRITQADRHHAAFMGAVGDAADRAKRNERPPISNTDILNHKCEFVSGKGWQWKDDTN